MNLKIETACKMLLDYIASQIKEKGLTQDYIAKKNTSLSGKTILFFASLTNEQYLEIAPNAPFKKKGGASVSLGATGVVEVGNGGNYWFKIENKKVTIL